jgi:predicted polyphosphate/ATP-dependent NAD kinase
MIYRLGLLINPIAGMGGPVGLHGTDGPDLLSRAQALGARPLAHDRTMHCLIQLQKTETRDIFTSSGAMGEDALRAAGLRPVVVHRSTYPTSAVDTRSAAQSIIEAGANVLLFAGGDGTARDVFDAVGRRALILGIPTGVKMHSAVFSISPGAAGQLAAALSTSAARVEEQDGEIMDREESTGSRAYATRLFGYARVPRERRLMQSAKAGASFADEASLNALCASIASAMERDRLYLFGPGTTTARILSHRRLEGSLLGVDAVRNGELIGRDLSEDDILSLFDHSGATIIVGLIGGQGCLFGRGNQQLGARVLRRVGQDNIKVVASLEKIASLRPRRLFVDTGDAALDASFSGYIRVEVGPGKSVMVRVEPQASTAAA